MRRLLIVTSVFALLMFSCKGKQTAETAESAPVDTVAQTDSAVLTEPTDTMEQLITETPMPRAADELFDDFLFNFAANSKLQMERVAFPLPMVKGRDTIKVDRKSWTIERFFMRQDFYTVIFDSERQMERVNDTSVEEAVVEKIYFNTGAVLQYQFKRIKGAWMLLWQKTEPISANRNASFLQFYHRFVTDSLYQAESLAETVLFSGPDPDDDFARMEGILTPDTWPAFAPELPDRMIFNITYGKVTEPSDRKIFVMRGIANGLEMELTFRHMNGRWQLTKLTT